MIRLLSRWFARWRYIWNEEVKAGESELNALAAAKNARDFKVRLERVVKEADDIEARIKEVAEMEEKGFWLCENGHESDKISSEGIDAFTSKCECGTAAKFIKRETMTGQEKYESDKERKEAEKIVENKRAEAAQIEEDIKNQENARSIFSKQAARSREFADALRKL